MIAGKMGKGESRGGIGGQIGEQIGELRDERKLDRERFVGDVVRVWGISFGGFVRRKRRGYMEEFFEILSNY